MVEHPLTAGIGAAVHGDLGGGALGGEGRKMDGAGAAYACIDMFVPWLQDPVIYNRTEMSKLANMFSALHLIADDDREDDRVEVQQAPSTSSTEETAINKPGWYSFGPCGPNLTSK
jgi:hypothetical protein